VTVRSGARSGLSPFHLLIILGLSLFDPFSHADGRELYRSGSRHVDFGATYKNLFLGNRFYEIPSVDERTQVTDYMRGRLTLDLAASQEFSLEVHYQQWAFVNPPQVPLGLVGILSVGDAASLYRYTPLAWDIESTADFLWVQEFDRLAATLSVGDLDFIFGRQAITWGTGRFWQPTDLFSPFGPLQVDREFKAGNDAARLALALNDFTQVEVVWAFGEDADPDRSAGAGKFKTLVKDYDLSVLGGWVQTDVVAGGDFAGDLGSTGIGLHGEVLFSHVEDPPDYLDFLVGLDYRFPGKGPYLLGEYYYYGAGAANPEGLNQVLGDNRILSRGTLLLGRHNLGLGASYEILPILTGMFNVLLNLTDPSAILNPVLEYSVADNAVATAGCTIPLGEAPTFLVPPGGLGAPKVRVNSEYGTYPFTFFIEVRLYMQ
jgi:hypothetical protein